MFTDEEGMPVIAGVLLVCCCAGMTVLAVRRGFARECAYTYAALLVLVLGTRVSLATGWWGIVFWPATLVCTATVIVKGGAFRG
jgi:hypothetical protein